MANYLFLFYSFFLKVYYCILYMLFVFIGQQSSFMMMDIEIHKQVVRTIKREATIVMVFIII